MGTKMQGDGQEPRQTFRVAPKIATIRLGFRVHLGNPGSRAIADTATSAPTGQSFDDDVNDNLLPATVYKNIGPNRSRRDGARPHWVTPAIPFRILMCGDQPERSYGV